MSNPVDLDEVIRHLVWELQEGEPTPDRDIYLKHLNSLCARVEEEAIQRSGKFLFQNDVLNQPRLYRGAR